MNQSLSQLLEYKNQAVINRYKKEFPQNANRADILFSDLMRFFWLSKKHSNEKIAYPDRIDLDFTFIMDDDMKEIDHMWHVFLLYTQEYMIFCQKYFGEYLHHLPDVVQTTPTLVTNFTTNLEKFLSYVFDNLGESVVRRWFAKTLSI